MADEHHDGHGGGPTLPPIPVNALLLVMAYLSTFGALVCTWLLFLPTPPFPITWLLLPAGGAYGGVLFFWGLYLAFKEKG